MPVGFKRVHPFMSGDHPIDRIHLHLYSHISVAFPLRPLRLCVEILMQVQTLSTESSTRRKNASACAGSIQRTTSAILRSDSSQVKLPSAPGAKKSRIPGRLGKRAAYGSARSGIHGGGKRMVMSSRGVRYTIVNGITTYADGEEVGAAAGKVLRC
jgi:hypothetical protein